MTKTIFRNTFLVGTLVLMICALLFFGLEYKQTVNETFEALEQETSYAETGLKVGGEEFLKKLDDTNRVTWIDKDGNVLYDSEFDLSVSNQSSYSEVSDAFEKGEGSATRRSGSSGRQTIYYAKKLDDGSVLRLSRPVSAVWHALVAVSPILWVLVLVLMISGILSFRAAKQIVTPINNMNFDDHGKSPYPELTPLLEKIEEQKLMIQEESTIREEMRREFTANVTDELKAPIISISESSRILANSGLAQEKTEEISQNIYKESQRLVTLIDDIMKLSKLDEAVNLPPKAEVDLHELLENVAKDLKPVADKNNISIDVKGEPVTIMGDKQLLYEMMTNLCDNAIKYNYPGGKVILKTEEDDQTINLSVSDTGIGIPKEHQKRVFERFYRVDKTRSKETGGTGLGLSIVKHGAMYHGAEVSLESEEGKGTTITISFRK